MPKNTCLKIVTQSHFTPAYDSYSSFTEWTVIADLEDCYHDDEPTLTEQIRNLVEESYETADGRRLEQHIIELADWEEFENDLFIPHPTNICQHFFTFNRLVSKEEFLELYHFGEYS